MCANAFEQRRVAMKAIRISCVNITLLVGGLLLLYLLSVGPAYRLLCTQRLQQRTFSTFYSPLLFVSHHSEVTNKVLDWYTDLWFDGADEVGKWFENIHAQQERRSKKP